MRKVTTVVPVFITSCQVSEKPKRGPVIAHTTITSIAVMNAHGRPVNSAIFDATRENQWLKPR
jgi:hypothetical protein